MPWPAPESVAGGAPTGGWAGPQDAPASLSAWEGGVRGSRFGGRGRCFPVCRGSRARDRRGGRLAYPCLGSRASRVSRESRACRLACRRNPSSHASCRAHGTRRGGHGGHGHEGPGREGPCLVGRANTGFRGTLIAAYCGRHSCFRTHCRGRWCCRTCPRSRAGEAMLGAEGARRHREEGVALVVLV